MTYNMFLNNLSFDVIINEVNIGFATVAYHYQNADEFMRGVLTVQNVLHGGLNEIDGIRLSQGNWPTHAEEEIYGNDTIQAKEIITRLIREAIINFDEYTVVFVPRREVYYVDVNENSIRMLLILTYDYKSNLKHLLALHCANGNNNAYNWNVEDEDIIRQGFYCN